VRESPTATYVGSHRQAWTPFRRQADVLFQVQHLIPYITLDETGLLRAGELTPIWVPDETHEAMRDMVRARESAAEDQRHKRQFVSAFMLRHGRVYHRTKPWTMRYRRW